MFGALFELQKV